MATTAKLGLDDEFCKTMAGYGKSKEPQELCMLLFRDAVMVLGVLGFKASGIVAACLITNVEYIEVLVENTRV